MNDQRKQCTCEGECTCDQMLNGARHSAEFYEIRCQGHLGDHWNSWFAGMSMIHEEDGITSFTGPVIDQPALFGLLDRVRDLGVALISVRRLNLNSDVGQLD